jgi:uncharacterized protein involved in outer membrane biogenesis
MKILKWAIVIVLVLIIGGGLILYFSLNRIIRTTVQAQTQKQLDVKTELSAAHLSLLGGSLSLTDFTLGSPKGFSAPQMFSMNKASVDVKYSELNDNPVRIRDITIQSPTLTIEQNNGKLNFKALMDQRPETKPADPNQKPMQLIIDKLTIANPVVVLRPGVPGLASEMTLPLQSITMQNIGNAEGNQNGAAVQDVVMRVVNSMAAEAAHSDKIPKELQALLSLNVDQITAQLGQQVNEQVGKLTGELNQQINKTIGKQLGGPATNAVNDAVKQVTGDQDAGQAVQKGLQGLFNQDKGKKKPATQPK